MTDYFHRARIGLMLTPDVDSSMSDDEAETSRTGRVYCWDCGSTEDVQMAQLPGRPFPYPFCKECRSDD